MRFSEKDEKQFLEAMGRGLLREFPNPTRTGCPHSTVLQGIASHRTPLAQAEPWLQHITSCSPCYQDVCDFRRADQHRKRRAFAVAAGVLIVAALAGWAVLERRSQNQTLQTAVFDLRDRSLSRGVESPPPQPPLQATRRVTHINLYLPWGSPVQRYDVRIATPGGTPIAAASAQATRKESITLLPVVVDLSSAPPGRYFLELRSTESEWQSYPLLLQ
jgi:hypothetical protein